MGHPDDGLTAVAARAARRYARRVFWADEEDLRQEAMIAALRARGTWDPDVGVPLTAYAWRACVFHLRRYLWKQSAPVGESDHKLATLRGVHRAELHETSAITDVDASSLLGEKEWTEDVRAQLDYLFGKHGDGDLVARVLLNEESPAAVAYEAGVPVAHLYKITRRARLAIGDSAYLFYLWRQRS